MICGDGLLFIPETCDDGNKTDGQGCKSDCSGTLSGYVCQGGNATDPSVCEPICGDGKINPPENCDDGGGNDDDGCL